jgi:hypothetical protein
MGTPEVFNNTAFPAGDWGSGGADHVGTYSGGTTGSGTARLTGTLTEVGSTATAVIGGQALTLRAYSDTTGGVVFTTPDFATFYIFTRTSFSPSQQYPLSYTVAGNSGLPCFLAGTRIATPLGEVAVERLRPGARVVTLRRGGFAPVRWLGRRRICHGGPPTWPVRILAGAFAAGVPRRDLLLSPDHAVFAGGGLIPVRYLCNGATIAPVPLRHCDYWHVELPPHDLLLAEGLPAESFLDTGNRRMFERDSAAGAAPHPPASARRVWARHGCAPLLLARAAQAPVRRHLLARAGALGHALTGDPALAIGVGSAILRPEAAGPHQCFALPPGVRHITLISRSTIPAETEPESTDPRRLGVAVTHLVLDGTPIAPDHPARQSGWHAPEPGLHWTDGAAVLCCGEPVMRPRLLEIGIAPLLRYWYASPPLLAAA